MKYYINNFIRVIINANRKTTSIIQKKNPEKIYKIINLHHFILQYNDDNNIILVVIFEIIIIIMKIRPIDNLWR